MSFAYCDPFPPGSQCTSSAFYYPNHTDLNQQHTSSGITSLLESLLPINDPFNNRDTEVDRSEVAFCKLVQVWKEDYGGKCLGFLVECIQRFSVQLKSVNPSSLISTRNESASVVYRLFNTLTTAVGVDISVLIFSMGLLFCEEKIGTMKKEALLEGLGKHKPIDVFVAAFMSAAKFYFDSDLGLSKISFWMHLAGAPSPEYWCMVEGDFLRCMQYELNIKCSQYAYFVELYITMIHASEYSLVASATLLHADLPHFAPTDFTSTVPDCNWLQVQDSTTDLCNGYTHDATIIPDGSFACVYVQKTIPNPLPLMNTAGAGWADQQFIDNLALSHAPAALHVMSSQPVAFPTQLCGSHIDLPNAQPWSMHPWASFNNHGMAAPMARTATLYPYNLQSANAVPFYPSYKTQPIMTLADDRYPAISNGSHVLPTNLLDAFLGITSDSNQNQRRRRGGHRRPAHQQKQPHLQQITTQFIPAVADNVSLAHQQKQPHLQQITTQFIPAVADNVSLPLFSVDAGMRRLEAAIPRSATSFGNGAYLWNKTRTFGSRVQQDNTQTQMARQPATVTAEISQLQQQQQQSLLRNVPGSLVQECSYSSLDGLNMLRANSADFGGNTALISGGSSQTQLLTATPLYFGEYVPNGHVW
ncbi:hypothetical protein BJ742DRAFT_872821 [Cladochytrium replicatum]|nr:hypothetical protein BJ742DRAFT_872821 [Cladochytrium replicatum]